MTRSSRMSTSTRGIETPPSAATPLVPNEFRLRTPSDTTVSSSTARSMSPTATRGFATIASSTVNQRSAKPRTVGSSNSALA
ncbi:Uncharacterised protein [Mycobacteroides abscessus subsp. abscessus]|nr:Uncharacterised protein [Mycobacteroides abscessus subsp. abscessus]